MGSVDWMKFPCVIQMSTFLALYEEHRAGWRGYALEYGRAWKDPTLFRIGRISTSRSRWQLVSQITRLPIRHQLKRQIEFDQRRIAWTACIILHGAE